jgi:hypothetical protein
MSWFSANLGSLIGWAITLITIILALGRNLWLTSQINEKVTKLEGDFASHLQSPTLHRTIDGEKRLERIEEKVDQLLQGGR